MPPPIRIAQVVEAVEGGCKKHVLDLVCGLDADRFRQTVVFSTHRDPGFGEQIRVATTHRAETISCEFRREIAPPSDLAAYRFLRRLFRQRDFDIIHCHSAKAGIVGRLAARGLRAATLYTPHCFPFQMQASPLVRQAYLLAERVAGRYTDRLIAVSPSEAEMGRRLGVVPPERIVTIESGIDPRRTRVPLDRRRKREELRIEEGRPTVLAVGALRPQKGYHYLIRAVPTVVGRLPRAAFLIAGQGPLRDELAQLASRLGVGESVRLLGPRDDVPELLGIADCFVMPSLWEGGPYALLEAMAAGVPVVGSDIPGIRDWVREGETGYLSPPRDASGLAKAIAACLERRHEAQTMAEAAREMVLARNTYDRWIADMAALYEGLVDA